MAWLADLVDSSEGSLEVLPVQCLCEFLLHDEPDMYGADDDKFVKKVKICSHIRLIHTEPLWLWLDLRFHFDIRPLIRDKYIFLPEKYNIQLTCPDGQIKIS